MRKLVRFISGLMLCIFIVTTVGIIDFCNTLYSIQQSEGFVGYHCNDYNDT